MGAPKPPSFSAKPPLDLSSMAAYEPMAGFARLGGKATFVEQGSGLRTASLEYDGVTYTPGEAAADRVVTDGLAAGRWAGWKVMHRGASPSAMRV